MLKTDLRKFYLEKRQSLTELEIDKFSKEIFENFLNKFNLADVKKVHCFLPIEKFKEINTQFFIDYFWENNIEVFVPKIVENELISIQIFPETNFIKNSWGILEPESNENHCLNDFDLVLTPLLYADKSGNRVGYGKGFYDRFFRNLPKSTLKVGLNYFPPTEDIEDTFREDIVLDYLVTPTVILSFFDGISKFTK